MKKYYFLFNIIIVFLFIVRCDIDKNPISSYSDKYEGKWRWIQTAGGLFPSVSTPKDGLILIIQYDKENKFRIFKNDTIKVIADYTYEKADSLRDKISYKNIVTYDFYFNRNYEYAYLHGDTLEIWDGMFDGYFSWYIKE